MKNQILNLGKALNKKEQKEINGGTYYPICECDSHCNVINNGRCDDVGCPMQAESIGPIGSTTPYPHPVC